MKVAFRTVLALLALGASLLAVDKPGTPAGDGVVFTDVTRQLGIDWTHTNGATPEHYLIEAMGGGGAFLDYDRDGRMDILLVDSGCHRFSAPTCRSRGTALYHQNADGTFSDVTRKAGLTSITYGMGVAVGDFDNDGYPDLYVTGYGSNILYHNNGNGTFTDVTGKAGVAAGGWSSSAVWFDYNKDGRLDLYVVRYLDWQYDSELYCGERRPGYRAYCHPDKFKGTVGVLYRNNGDGTFTDVTEKAGLTAEGKGLGAIAFDYNKDGWPDLYVTNDTVRNFLYRNNGDGTFTEVGLTAEVAYGSSGRPASGMGVDTADLYGDGYPALFVTNIDYEPNNLFHNNGDETFTDYTVVAKLGSMALLYSGFGTKFLDYDNDGLQDLFVANGHPLENIQLFHDGVTGSEKPFLIRNLGDGKFADVTAQHGEALGKLYNGRGLAVGDFNNDGAPDVLLVQDGGAPALLRNDGGNRNNWVGFELVGTRSNRDAVNAVVTVIAGGKTQRREKVGGSSYCSAQDPRLLFGLGSATEVEKVEIAWPSGGVTTMEKLAARKYYRVEEPRREKDAKGSR